MDQTSLVLACSIMGGIGLIIVLIGYLWRDEIPQLFHGLFWVVGVLLGLPFGILAFRILSILVRQVLFYPLIILNR